MNDKDDANEAADAATVAAMRALMAEDGDYGRVPRGKMEISVSDESKHGSWRYRECLIYSETDGELGSVDIHQDEVDSPTIAPQTRFMLTAGEFAVVALRTIDALQRDLASAQARVATLEAACEGAAKSLDGAAYHLRQAPKGDVGARVAATNINLQAEGIRSVLAALRPDADDTQYAASRRDDESEG